MLTRGFDESFLAPHSRYADFPTEVIRQYTDLDILAESEQAGAYLFASRDKRLAFVTGHPEYDTLTLAGGSIVATTKLASILPFRSTTSPMTTPP